MSVKRYRVFNGLRYERSNIRPLTKTQAKQGMAYYRKKGLRATYIKHKDGYTVYTRKK